MLGGKSIAAIFSRKCIPVVEGEPKRSRVRLDENIGNGDLPFQMRTFAGVPRIFVAADIVPWPPVECPFAHPRDVIRHQIVSHTVAFIGRAIQGSGGWMNSETNAIADTGSKGAQTFSVGVERQHRRTVGLASP